jgi:hypothetical protein
MGLVCADRENSPGLNVAIPMLAEWLKRNDSAPSEGPGSRAKVRAGVALLLGVGMIGLALFSVMRGGELQPVGPLRYQLCTLNGATQKRATEGQHVELLVSAENCDVKTDAQVPAMVGLQAIDEPSLSGVSGPLTEPLRCHGRVCSAQFGFTLGAVGGHAFELAVTTSDDHVRVTIENDPAALAKRRFADALGAASAMLTGLGLIAAFHRRLRRLLGPILAIANAGRSRRGESA